MKRILGLAALLGQALSMSTGIKQAYSAPFAGGKRRYYAATRPTAARWWHDIANPAQGLRFDAAVAKRERRACKLHNAHARGWTNPAHRVGYEFSPNGRVVGFTIPVSLSPTYVAK